MIKIQDPAVSTVNLLIRYTRVNTRSRTCMAKACIIYSVYARPEVNADHLKALRFIRSHKSNLIKILSEDKNSEEFMHSFWIQSSKTSELNHDINQLETYLEAITNDRLFRSITASQNLKRYVRNCSKHNSEYN